MFYLHNISSPPRKMLTMLKNLSKSSSCVRSRSLIQMKRYILVSFFFNLFKKIAQSIKSQNQLNNTTFVYHLMLLGNMSRFRVCIARIIAKQTHFLEEISNVLEKISNVLVCVCACACLLFTICFCFIFFNKLS